MTTKEAGEIVLLGVYCDSCGVTQQGDFKVRASDSSEVRLGYVRAWAEERGWSCRPGLDLCEGCSKHGAELLKGLEEIGEYLRAGEYLAAAATLADVQALVKAGRR
ncbi:hypothetical protein PBI_MELONS_59 [Arthrobacter phage Melons]|uniref:Uncharacterized protein n=1 Tax=Arthrobacter phage Melons TaxID=2419962 RepID=A0A3G2KHZ2_9CAUD|nr:hypothetical protein PBI_MELONS_59 [Arthrobacter phage Melons]